MKFITDLVELEKLADAKLQENTRFRTWLKSQDLSKIEDSIDKIGRVVASNIDCTKCGNCCKALTIVPKSSDIRRLSEGLDLDPYQFKLKYLKKDHEGDLVFKQRPCPFLKNNMCSVYEHRPDTCRSYPHLEKQHMAGRGWYILNNTRVCPIVYNTYEELKKFWNYKDKPADLDR